MTHDPNTSAPSSASEAVIRAAMKIDWQQTVGESPCFHLESDGRFCGRSSRWDGHGPLHLFEPLYVAITRAAKHSDALAAIEAAREQGRREGWDEAKEAAAEVADRNSWIGCEASADEIAKEIRALARPASGSEQAKEAQ